MGIDRRAANIPPVLIWLRVKNSQPDIE